MIFADKVQVKLMGNFKIYKLVSVIAMELTKFKRHTGLSILLSEYFGNNFYFSYHIDLTFSQNFSKILKNKIKN